MTRVFATGIFGALGENAAAERHARQAFAAYALDPWANRILRNADLRKGDVNAARARYESSYPDLLNTPTPHVVWGNYVAAIDCALVLQKSGEVDKAMTLLNRSELAVRQLPRLGWAGYGIADVQIHALRGEKVLALAKLREAEQAGWRYLWRYHRDSDPNLASIRSDPEFKAIFADIERDMAAQRAALAARPKDAPLELSKTGT
jgi:ATP/maltotriose-dependent transcriptional regulator MalT